MLAQEAWRQDVAMVKAGVLLNQGKGMVVVFHGSLNVPIEHHPTFKYMVYNGYYKVMSNISKMGQLPTPVFA